MGKAQSKRSVDITTDVKKDDVIEEGTGKMEKIEDVDQLKPQINGDTHHNDTENTEKTAAETEGTENEKDLSTEKEQQKNSNPDIGDVPEVVADEMNNKAIENGNDETLNESKEATGNAAETTGASENGAAGDSSKKPKKEKVKKKWSLRSISFGKKDKQKPAKKEESSGAINGECEKVPEESTEDPASPNAEIKTEAVISETSEVIAEKTEKIVEASVPETSTPVVNGSSTEPSKDAIPSGEKTPDNTPATTPEEKKPEAKDTSVSNVIKDDTPKKSETVAEPSANGKTTKTNETEEQPAATKIEVKLEESIQETKNDDSSIEKVEDQEKISNENNNDGDSESAQNLPPPPLPCNPPPSQVMVFALGDDKVTEQEIQPKVERTSATEIKIDSPIAIVAAEKPIESDKKSEEKLQEIDTSNVPVPDAPVIVGVTRIETIESVVEVSKPSDNVPTTNEPEKELETKTETQSSVEIVSSNASENIETVEKPIAIEETIQKEIIQSSETVPVSTDYKLEDEKKVETVLNEGVDAETKKIESEIKPEQIAETIALIDEITKEAIIMSQERPVELPEKSAEVNVAADVVSSSDDDKTKSNEQQTITENSSTAPSLPEDKSNSIPPTMAPEINSITETMIPSENVSQVPEEIKPIDIVPTPALVSDVIGDNIQLESNETPKSDATEMKTEQIKNTQDENDVLPPPADSINEVKDTSSENTTVIETGDCHKDDKQPDSKLKENGIGENHQQPAETSATESLNGQVEHKTAEEIKAEFKEKANIEVTPEIAAGTVAE